MEVKAAVDESRATITHADIDDGDVQLNLDATDLKRCGTVLFTAMITKRDGHWAREDVDPVVILPGDPKQKAKQDERFDQRVKVIRSGKGVISIACMLNHYIPHLVQAKKKAGIDRLLLIMDSCTSHTNQSVLNALLAENIFVSVVPAGMTSRLQWVDTHFCHLYRCYHTRAYTHGWMGFKKNASQKRRLFAHLVAEGNAKALSKVDVVKAFASLGYIFVEGIEVKVRDDAEYTFARPELSPEEEAQDLISLLSKIESAKAEVSSATQVEPLSNEPPSTPSPAKKKVGRPPKNPPKPSPKPVSLNYWANAGFKRKAESVPDGSIQPKRERSEPDKYEINRLMGIRPPNRQKELNVAAELTAADAELLDDHLYLPVVPPRNADEAIKEMPNDNNLFAEELHYGVTGTQIYMTHAGELVRRMLEMNGADPTTQFVDAFQIRQLEHTHEEKRGHLEKCVTACLTSNKPLHFLLFYHHHYLAFTVKPELRQVVSFDGIGAAYNQPRASHAQKIISVLEEMGHGGYHHTASLFNGVKCQEPTSNDCAIFACNFMEYMQVGEWGKLDRPTIGTLESESFFTSSAE